MLVLEPSGVDEELTDGVGDGLLLVGVGEAGDDDDGGVVVVLGELESAPPTEGCDEGAGADELDDLQVEDLDFVPDFFFVQAEDVGVGLPPLVLLLLPTTPLLCVPFPSVAGCEPLWGWPPTPVLLTPPFPELGENPWETSNPAYTPAASTAMAKTMTVTGRRKPSRLGRPCRFAGPGTNRSTVR